MNILKPVGRFLKRNGPTILCITASAGVVISNYLTGKAVLEADKILSRPHDENTKKEVIKTYIPPVIASTATIACIIGAHLANKKIQAGLIAAYGAVNSVFEAYRMKNDAERDKQIMTEIAVERIKADDIPQTIEEGCQLWTDPYIAELSHGTITSYEAAESDILWAAMYMKDTFYMEGDVSIRTFYNILRQRGVDIPYMEGENDIYWEIDDDWYDWYGDFRFEFDWSVAHNEFGAEVNTIIFSLTNEEMKEQDENIHWFVENLAKQKAEDKLA